jgi:L-amino acid N-acyltransferase YncA
MEIRQIAATDYDQVAVIYEEGIATGIATFQQTAPDWPAWNQGHLAAGRLAAFEGVLMTGWAALSPVSARPVYAGVAEVSIYIRTAFRGMGIGKLLLQRLIDESEAAGIWTLQSGIFRENTASIQLHLNCGFRIVGYREKIGLRDGIWRDNILMERRSKTIG